MADHPGRRGNAHQTGNLRIDAGHLPFDLIDLELDALGPERDLLPGRGQREGALFTLEEPCPQRPLQGRNASGYRCCIDLETFRRKSQPAGASQGDQVRKVGPVLMLHFCSVQGQDCM